MSKKSSSKQQVTDYRLSVHYGVCSGPVDSVNYLVIGDKNVAINQSVSSVFEINQPNLFGGPQQGGGVVGNVALMFGEDDQVMDNTLAAKFGRTSATMSAYRGILTLFFYGLDYPGFNWSTNNPTVPAVKVNATRSPKGLSDHGGGSALIDADANPAHIIFECLTDQTWGKGNDISGIDIPSFVAVAQTLRDENLGLSFEWSSSTAIEDFINQVLSHINGILNESPRTKLWTLSLLRADYDINSLTILSPKNCVLTSFQRKGWGETVNEVVVTWTNPNGENQETVTIHDNANISIQAGEVVSTNVDYSGARTSDLALRLGLRDLQQVSAPLASVSVSGSGVLSDVLPGDVKLFVWPEYNMPPLVGRVTSVEYGTTDNPGTKIVLTEDVFGFDQINYLGDSTNWTNPDQPPSDLDKVLLTSVPYFLIASLLGDTQAQAIDYPVAFSLSVPLSTNGAAHNIDVEFEIDGDFSGTNYESAGVVDPQTGGTLPVSLIFETESTFSIAGYFGAGVPSVGNFLILSNTATPELQEITQITAVAGTVVTVSRGLLDTVPLAWASGQDFWIIRPDSRFYDSHQRAVSETPVYKFLMTTGLGRLALADATAHTFELTERLYQPYRPANLTVNGTLAASVNVVTADTSFAVAWSQRNRLTETSAILKWNDADVAPESGQTTTVQVYDKLTNTLLHSYTAISGTSQAVPMVDMGTITDQQVLEVRVKSVRDGYDSRGLSTIDLVMQGNS